MAPEELRDTQQERSPELRPEGLNRMGQAKRRGTFEQRKAEGEAKIAERRKFQQERLLAQEAAMTPEQKEARRKAREWLTVSAGLVAGITTSAT